MLAITRQLSVAARVPLTQRAFRLPAGSRVTFLLLAQKKSNPKKMASRAHSIAWDTSLTAVASQIGGGPRPLHSGYTATRHSAEGLKRGWCRGPQNIGMPQAFRPSARPALSPHRVGALLCSRCVAAVGRQPFARPDLPTLLSNGVLPALEAIPLGYFSLGQQRKVTRLPAGSRNARCVSGTLAISLGFSVIASTHPSSQPSFPQGLPSGHPQGRRRVG